MVGPPLLQSRGATSMMEDGLARRKRQVSRTKKVHAYRKSSQRLVLSLHNQHELHTSGKSHSPIHRASALPAIAGTHVLFPARPHDLASPIQYIAPYIYYLLFIIISRIPRETQTHLYFLGPRWTNRQVRHRMNLLAAPGDVPPPPNIIRLPQTNSSRNLKPQQASRKA